MTEGPSNDENLLFREPILESSKFVSLSYQLLSVTIVVTQLLSWLLCVGVAHGGAGGAMAPPLFMTGHTHF
jgi:hypothetical protein